MNRSPESRGYNPPREIERQPTIILHFFRHGEKARGDFNAGDAMPISEKGRRQAEEKGRALHPNPRHALAYGSPRIRSQETAVRTLLAEHGINSSAEPEDIEKFLKTHVPFGKKLLVDERLNFHYEGDIEKGVMKAINEGEYIPFLVDESDAIEIERRKQQVPNPSTSFSILAGNIAELVKKYGLVAAPVDRLIENNKIDADHIERYLGSHGGVLESFSVKVLQVTKNDEALAAFMNTYKKGFAELEGIQVSTAMQNNAPVYTLTFTANNETYRIPFSHEDLEKIIQDKKLIELYDTSKIH